MRSKRYDLTFEENGKQVTVVAIMSNVRDDFSIEDATKHYESEHPGQKVISLVDKGDVDRKTIEGIAAAVNSGQAPANPFVGEPAKA